MLLKTVSELLLRNPSKLVLVQCSKMSSATDDVLFKELANKGSILLNRPKALNALNVPMIRKIYPTLIQWEAEGKDLVLIEGAGDKAFCAGGDVRAVADSSKKRGTDPLSKEFFFEEYQLNYKIATLKIPYVALIHGITMGGGVGLSVHGNFRVATEKTLFAMPETAIGLFPDVGGTYVLPRMQGSLGMYLALTGCRLKGYDVLHAGIATHFTPSEKVPDIYAALMNLGEKPDLAVIDEVLQRHSPSEIPEFSLKKVSDQIEKHFCLNTVEEIMESLEKDGSTWAKQTKETLLKLSPTSLKITMEALKRGKNLSLEECFKMEFRLSQHCMMAHDFYEGVRALLIDKDQNPKWVPPTLEEVTDERVASFFEPVDGVPDLIL